MTLFKILRGHAPFCFIQNSVGVPRISPDSVMLPVWIDNPDAALSHVPRYSAAQLHPRRLESSSAIARDRTSSNILKLHISIHPYTFIPHPTSHPLLQLLVNPIFQLKIACFITEGPAWPHLEFKSYQ